MTYQTCGALESGAVVTVVVVSPHMHGPHTRGSSRVACAFESPLYAAVEVLSVRQANVAATPLAHDQSDDTRLAPCLPLNTRVDLVSFHLVCRISGLLDRP